MELPKSKQLTNDRPSVTDAEVRGRTNLIASANPDKALTRTRNFFL